MRKALERHQWDKIAAHHFDYDQTIKFNHAKNEVLGNIKNIPPSQPIWQIQAFQVEFYKKWIMVPILGLQGPCGGCGLS
jgi:hypothetical protein